MIILLIILIFILYENTDILLNLGSWFHLGQIKIEWNLRYDSLTRIMLIPIITISLLVQIFSYIYLKGDPHITRYYSYLNLFTLKMLILVTGDNFFILFLGWEGVGLASYLLVNFWFTRLAANFASLKAFLINRIGDWGLSLGIILWIIIMNDSSFLLILDNINKNIIYLLSICLIIGAFAKSAQFGLHTWLTSAMEGPTPVSALLHAATMVTAGIYLIIRLSYFFEWCDIILIIIMWFGSLSALLGSIGGLIEYDIKKIIAYSTISQLGYMIVATSINLYNLSLWHLINHAYFKALLFLSAGSIIFSFLDNQDLRKYGTIHKFLPHLYNLFLIGNFSLIAFPFLSGFYSKDLIIELTLSQNKTIIFLILFLTACLSTLYTLRLFLFSFFSKPNYNYNFSLNFSSNLSLFFKIPLIILSIGSIILGYITQNILYSSKLDSFIHPIHNNILNNLIFSNIFSIISFILFFLLILPIFNLKYFPNWKGRINILNNLNIYYHYFILSYFLFSNLFLRYFDRGLIEILTPYGLINLLNYLSYKLDILNSSFFLHYFSFLFFSFLFFIFF